MPADSGARAGLPATEPASRRAGAHERAQEPVFLEWLHQAGRAAAHHGVAVRHAVVGGDEDEGKLPVQLTKDRGQVEAAEAWQVNVREHARRV